MIKVKLEHGDLFGQHKKNSPYGFKVIITDDETSGSCDVIGEIPSLDRLSKNAKEGLFKTLEHHINHCIRGFNGKIPTIEYQKIDYQKDEKNDK